MMVSDRAVAAGAVDEVNAAVGACLCTGQVSTATAAVLRDVQGGLTDISRIVDGRAEPRDDVDVLLADLESTADRWAQSGTAENALAGGHCLGAGLLRWARTVAQRASRCVAVLDQQDERTDRAARYLTILPRVLDAVASELDAEEQRSVPTGMCVQP